MQIDENKYRLQQAYVNSLREMKIKELKGLHARTFEALPVQFSMKIPYWANRKLYERRLFLVFAAKNYHFPRGSKERAAFFQQVRSVLLSKFDTALTQDDKDVRKEIQKHTQFSRAKVKSMDIRTVNKYLAELGYVFTTDIPAADRRRVLWEYFNLPGYKLRVREVTQRIRRLNPQDSRRLKAIIKKYSTIDWHTFVEHFADELPLVDNSQFRAAKTALRRAGYKIPKLDGNGRTAAERRRYLDKLRHQKNAKKKAQRSKRANRFKGEVTIQLSAIFQTNKSQDEDA